MKRHTRVLLILAGVSAAAGIGLSVAGAVMGAGFQETGVSEFLSETLQRGGIVTSLSSWNFESSLSGLTYRDYRQVEKEGGKALKDGNDVKVYQASAAENMELEVELSYETFHMEPYDGDEIRVEVSEDSDEYVSVRQKKQELAVYSSGKNNNAAADGVILYYPENLTFESADISIGAGSAVLIGELKAQELDIEVGAGSLTDTGQIQAQECSVSVGAGEASLQYLDAAEIDVECGLGDFEMTLAGVETDYNFDLECAMGDMTVGSEKFSGLAMDKEIDNGAGRSVDLECGLGSVTVDFKESKNGI